MEEHKQFFEKLKSIRLENNITLEEISEKTKIRLSYLKAIEEGDIEKIPSVYDKLFFQSYLDEIKAEKPDYYLETFQQIRKALRSEEPTTMTTIRTVKTDEKSLVRKRVILVGLPVFLTLMIVIIFALSSKKVETPSDQTVKEVPVREIVDKLEEREQARRDSVAAVQARQRRLNSVATGFKAREVTWLRYVKDRADTNEILMQPQDSVGVEADSVLEFLIGKANGLDFTVNGEKVGILGKPGEIITNLTITKEGIVQKRIKPKASAAANNDTTSAE